MKISKELKIGVFVVTVLVMSYFLINYLRGKDIFNREIELTARYEAVEGLSPSAPVYIKGYKAGKVTSVEYDSSSEDFKVVCSVRKEFRIPVDSRMTIYSVDIMGGKGVRIDLGASHDAVKDEGVLASSFEAGLMDGLSAGVAPLLSKVTSAVDSLSVSISGINRLLSPENQEIISHTLANLDNAMSGVSRLASDIGDRSADIMSIIDDMASLSSNLSVIAEKADTVMTDLTVAADGLSDADFAGVVNSLNDVLRNINDPDGTIGRLFVDDSVYSSVDSLLRNIDDLIGKISENPKKYLRISVF